MSRMRSQDENLVRPLYHLYLHYRLQLYPRSYFAERRQHNANPASGIDPTFPFLCCTKNRGLRVLVMYNDASILFPIASPSCDPYFHRLYIGRSFVKLRDCLHNGHSAYRRILSQSTMITQERSHLFSTPTINTIPAKQVTAFCSATCCTFFET